MIAGYCWPQSALPGETVTLYCHSEAARFGFEIVRRGERERTVSSRRQWPRPPSRCPTISRAMAVGGRLPARSPSIRPGLPACTWSASRTAPTIAPTRSSSCAPQNPRTRCWCSRPPPGPRTTTGAARASTPAATSPPRSVHCHPLPREERPREAARRPLQAVVPGGTRGLPRARLLALVHRGRLRELGVSLRPLGRVPRLAARVRHQPGPGPGPRPAGRLARLPVRRPRRVLVRRHARHGGGLRRGGR